MTSNATVILNEVKDLRLFFNPANLDHHTKRDPANLERLRPVSGHEFTRASKHRRINRGFSP